MILPRNEYLSSTIYAYFVIGFIRRISIKKYAMNYGTLLCSDILYQSRPLILEIKIFN